MHRISVFVVALVTAALPLRAQQREEPRGERPQFLFYETFDLPSDDTAQSRVDVHYRIDADFFVAVRNTDTSSSSQFVRRGEVLFELRDSTDVSRGRDISPIERGTNNPESNLDAREWCQGISSLSVPPGKYTLLVEITDHESPRRYRDRSRVVVAQSFTGVAPVVSTPMFIAHSDTGTVDDTLSPLNFGGNVLFGSKAALFCELAPVHGTGNGIRARYSIASLAGSSGEETVVQADSLAAAPALHNFTLEPAGNGDVIGYKVRKADSSRILGVEIPFACEKLLLRDYLMRVTIDVGGSEQRIEARFRTIWPDMPLSLRDIEYALDALRYIASPGEIDSLKHGDFAARRRHLEEFWESRAPATGSALNEVMAQYYRRVDHARRTFGTLKALDGAKTDRGRIFILYGPPTSTDRRLDPTGGFVEVWIYRGLSKKLTFLDTTKSGNYVLVSSTSL